ncbi:hypothetical protein NDU88_001171 [Pleurodeles waltl]|uniref:Uncharacterized protein n=1 Tax=Pleurodeles waltl TaxID=8319 RepID=A0AAV7P3B4_PLEWA|nr:hypothetical protein NDU88_001171 [Pleurodeles waltl]
MGPGAALTHQREGRKKKQGGHATRRRPSGHSLVLAGPSDSPQPQRRSRSVLPGSQHGPGVIGPTRCLCGSPSFQAGRPWPQSSAICRPPFMRSERPPF